MFVFKFDVSMLKGLFDLLVLAVTMSAVGYFALRDQNKKEDDKKFAEGCRRITEYFKENPDKLL